MSTSTIVELPTPEELAGMGELELGQEIFDELERLVRWLNMFARQDDAAGAARPTLAHIGGLQVLISGLRLELHQITAEVEKLEEYADHTLLMILNDGFIIGVEEGDEGGGCPHCGGTGLIDMGAAYGQRPCGCTFEQGDDA